MHDDRNEYRVGEHDEYDWLEYGTGNDEIDEFEESWWFNGYDGGEYHISHRLEPDAEFCLCDGDEVVETFDDFIDALQGAEERYF